MGIHAEEGKKLDKFDTTCYDIIIFDEFSMYNPQELAKIHNYILDHDNIRFGATGDSFQIESFGYNLIKVSDMEIYTMDQLTTKFNIVYFNYKADKINRYMNECIKKPEETFLFEHYNIVTYKKTKKPTKVYTGKNTILYKGLDIICKKYEVLKAELKADINIEELKKIVYKWVKLMKLGTNHKYKILAIDDNYIVIGNINE